jgi:hypothetical protein
VRDSSRYTTSPTTTDGKASAVLSKASTAPRPLKRDTPSQAPSNRPQPEAIAQAQALTASDRQTMLASMASSEVMREKAVTALSEKVFMRKVLRDFIVGAKALSAHRDSPAMNCFA